MFLKVYIDSNYNINMKSKLLVPFKPVSREMKENTTFRVSSDAVEAMTAEIIRIGKKISAKAWDLAKHSGRKTLKKQDIELAYDYYER